MAGPNSGQGLERRLHELESLFDLLPVGVAISHDRECREMIANDAFCEMLGVAPGVNPSKTGAEAGRLPFRVMKNGVEIAPESLPLQTAAREGIAVASSCEIVRDDGKTIVIQGRTTPLFDPQGRPCGSVGVFVDVTERERLIQELEAARQTVKTLAGLLPICARCKSIRSPDDKWYGVEEYIRSHSEAEFTHSLCPSCAHDFLASGLALPEQF